MTIRVSHHRIESTLLRALPNNLRLEADFDRWFEPMKRRIQIATQEVEEQVCGILDGMTGKTSSREACKRVVYNIFKGGDSAIKSAASVRSKIGRTLLEEGGSRRVLTQVQVRNLILRFPDLGRFRIVCALSSDVEEAVRVLLDAKQEKLAGRYPVVAAMKDYVEDLSKRTPASGHRAKQFAVAVRTGHGAETVRVEIQLMTTVQHAWDQRNHPIYEWSREGDKLPDHLVIRDVALAETLYLVDQQAAHNWQDILEWRKGKH